MEVAWKLFQSWSKVFSGCIFYKRGLHFSAPRAIMDSVDEAPPLDIITGARSKTMNEEFNVVEFIATHKNSTRNRTSAISEALKNHPAYITAIGRNGTAYYKIYYMKNGRVTSVLRLKNEYNELHFIKPLIQHGAKVKPGVELAHIK